MSGQPQIGSVSLSEDADAQLGLRGDVEINSVADFVAHQASLTHERREQLAHQLGIGRPHTHMPRDLGIPVDPLTGLELLNPDDPTLQDRDCDPEMYGKSPDEILAVLAQRETDPKDRLDDEDFVRELMQREVKIHGHGGGSKGRAKKRLAPATSTVDRTAAYASEKSLER